MADDLVSSIQAKYRDGEEELALLTADLEEVRHLYDQYFMGLERRPPEKRRLDLERAFRNARVRKSHRTEQKFRFQGLRARLMSYLRYWDRTMRDIEEGRFRRDRAHQSPGPTPAMLRAERAAAAAPDPMRQLFDDWTEARRQVGSPADVDFERFRARMEDQRQAQIQKYGWRDVGYSVKVKDGRVAMVAKRLDDAGSEG